MVMLLVVVMADGGDFQWRIHEEDEGLYYFIFLFEKRKIKA